jgi:hypothetical protein
MSAAATKRAGSSLASTLHDAGHRRGLAASGGLTGSTTDQLSDQHVGVGLCHMNSVDDRADASLTLR